MYEIGHKVYEYELTINKIQKFPTSTDPGANTISEATKAPADAPQKKLTFERSVLKLNKKKRMYVFTNMIWGL